MSLSPQDVYSRYLLGDRGYPLWTPQLNSELQESYRREGLKIGDVGVVSHVDGSFDVLFNITLQPSEQPRPGLVGDDFTPILLDQEVDLSTQLDAVAAHGVIPSASVQLTSKEITDRNQTPSSADYELSLSMENGAVLALPEGAQSCDLRNEKKFLDEAILHALDWYECATKSAGRLLQNDSLYLITGFHKARSWSLGAAGRADSNLENRRSVKFRVGTIQRGTVTAQAYSWVATHASGFIGRVGPTTPYEFPAQVGDARLRLGFNQTVFLRGFRITVNKLLFLKTVSVKTRTGTFVRFRTQLAKFLSRAKAGSTSSADATDNAEQDFSVNRGQVYADTRMTIDRMSDASRTFHPGDLINQYILSKNPGARVAITHDNIWIEMLQTGRLELRDFDRESNLERVLPRHYEVIREDGKCWTGCALDRFAQPNIPDLGVVYLQRGYDSGIAMEFLHPHKASYDLNAPAGSSARIPQVTTAVGS